MYYSTAVLYGDMAMTAWPQCHMVWLWPYDPNVTWCGYDRMTNVTWWGYDRMTTMLHGVAITTWPQCYIVRLWPHDLNFKWCGYYCMTTILNGVAMTAWPQCYMVWLWPQCHMATHIWLFYHNVTWWHGYDCMTQSHLWHGYDRLTCRHVDVCMHITTRSLAHKDNAI